MRSLLYAVILLAACDAPKVAPAATVSLPPPPAPVTASAAPTAAPRASSAPAASAALTPDAAIESVFALPEVKAFADAVERVSKGAAHLSAWVETPPPPGCRPGTPECRYQIYVGENHPDHMVRWQTFLVDPVTKQIWVANIESDDPDTYDAWRRRVRVTYKDFPEMRRLPALPPPPGGGGG